MVYSQWLHCFHLAQPGGLVCFIWKAEMIQYNTFWQLITWQWPFRSRQSAPSLKTTMIVEGMGKLSLSSVARYIQQRRVNWQRNEIIATRWCTASNTSRILLSFSVKVLMVTWAEVFGLKNRPRIEWESHASLVQMSYVKVSISMLKV